VHVMPPMFSCISYSQSEQANIYWMNDTQCTCVKHTYLYNMPSRSIVTQTIDIREGWCLIYVTYVCLRIVVSNTYCVDFCFVFLRLVYPMLTVSLDCPFLIVPSIFSSLFIYLCLHYFFYICIFLIAK
jgi:hypothetical protein